MLSPVRRGFTLVELLAVMAIIGMLMAVLIPAVIGTQNSYEKLATKDLVGGLQMALQIVKVEDAGYPLPDNQQSTVETDPGYLIGNFRWDRSEKKPGIINRLVHSQKFGFDYDNLLNEDNIVTDAWGEPIIYVRGDVKNNKHKSGYDNKLPQDLNKPKDASKPPADSDWNSKDDPGYAYIYSLGSPEVGAQEDAWIYQKD